MQLILKLINNTHHENTYNILRNCILQLYELENAQMEQCVTNRKGSLSAPNSTKFARKISLFDNFRTLKSSKTLGYCPMEYHYLCII